MPTLIETPSIEVCTTLCRELVPDFIERNNNLPRYQLDMIDPRMYQELGQKYNIFYTIHLEEELNVCRYNKAVTEAYLATVRRAIELAKDMKIPVLNIHLNSEIHITLPDRRVYLFQEYEERYFQKLFEFRQQCETKTIQGLTKSVERLHQYL